MQKFKYMLCFLMLLPLGSIQAQNDDFNPVNPGEPQVPIFYYPLTVTCQPASAARTSGNGRYAPGTTVTVSTSAYAGYTFSHWMLNGQPYSATTMSFQYVTTDQPMDFVAVYDFTPGDPSEPTLNVKSRLYLNSEPEGICTFNRTSGAFVEADTYVNVNITGVDQLFEFEGWYQDGQLLTNQQAFNYLVEYSDATLTARFIELPFDPSNPGEPASSADQTDIQTHATGDVNQDGLVNVADAMKVISAYLRNDFSAIKMSLADMNADGQINISDAVAIISVYLQTE